MSKGYYDRSKSNRKKRVAVTFHDNFWSKKRVEQNATVDEIAELLEINKKTVSAYFTGQLVPREHQIKELCEYFDVDIIEGTREFYNAHKHYDATRKRTLKFSAKTQKKIEEATKEKPAFDENPTPIEQQVAEKIAERTDKIMEAVYKKLDYDNYKALMGFIVVHEYAEIEKWLYEKVDFETFKKIEEILGG